MHNQRCMTIQGTILTEKKKKDGKLLSICVARRKCSQFARVFAQPFDLNYLCAKVPLRPPPSPRKSRMLYMEPELYEVLEYLKTQISFALRKTLHTCARANIESFHFIHSCKYSLTRMSADDQCYQVFLSLQRHAWVLKQGTIPTNPSEPDGFGS